MYRYRQYLMVLGVLLMVGCGASQNRMQLPATEGPLQLNRVVLYRNGIGYFERQGTVKGNLLTLRVRKDQVNDLLKSLTVVDKSTGQALSISIPLDPQSWQNAALAALSSTKGNLATILDGLRGTYLTVHTREGRRAEGRIVMVEEIKPPVPPEDAEVLFSHPGTLEHKLTLLNGSEVNVVKLSDVDNVAIHDSDLVMQLNRTLDASAGEGMFQQVEIAIRLSDNGPHDLVVSYVVAAPLWKPTYRIVLDEKEPGRALLQSWAVVDNTSGENWDDVSLSLTAGAPIAFRYDLHTPRNVTRPDLSGSGVEKRAAVAMGEATMDDGAYFEKEAEGMADMVATEMAPAMEESKMAMKRERVSGAAMKAKKKDRAFEEKNSMADADDEMRMEPSPAPPPAMAMSGRSMHESMQANATAKRVAGLSTFDLAKRVTLPDGSATMVALINEFVKGEQTFLFRPGGSGSGYEYNPYRVVRFTNSTEFVLESGPISIYSGGSFVGEGLSEAVAGKAETTIPFAVEPRIVVRSTDDYRYSDATLLKIVRGVLYTERFHRRETTWSVKGMKSKNGYKVLVRHPRAGNEYNLVTPKESDVDVLPDAYLVPIQVAANQTESKVTVVEQTPSRSSITIWDGNAVALLTRFLHLNTVTDKMKAQIQPIIDLRQEIGRIDMQIAGLEDQQRELDSRAEDTRENLSAIKKDTRATALRKKLSDRLDEFSQKSAQIGREIVEQNSQRLEKRIELDDLLKDLTLTP
ncbi:MAG: DUF4139 domain-containing protein [Deltaproteobacteria bacterium]|nr:DUF4139 domain-containing protein [Deltaproteobacteria bacterium]